ncbi:MAG: hypothetical protein HOP34_08955 [Methylococcaceae bacterium]|nr:hypothetical protein [Methylococcaceae bacterium]
MPNLNNQRWYRFVDTNLPGDLAIMDEAAMPALTDPHHYFVAARTTVVLVAR